MSKILLFILLGVLVGASVTASADRGSLNGGGLAEMKAISIHLHLREWLGPCRQRPASCDVEDAGELNSVYQAITQSTPEKLEINLTLKSRYSTNGIGSPIKIATREIYRADGLPKSSPEIAALLIEAIASQVSSASHTELALRLTAGFTENSSRTSFETASKLEVTTLVMKLHGRQHQFLFLEDAEKTLDLGTRLPELRKCPGTAIQNWRRIYESGTTTLAADVTLFCGGAATYQTLLISIHIDARGRINENSVSIVLRDSI